jgi:hypothetical protein
MLAYLFWHSPGDEVKRLAYESAAAALHRSLQSRPPEGFRGSACYRVAELPWLNVREAYEDWYLLDDFTALGVLSEAVVSRGHRNAHEHIARSSGAGAGGLYRLLEGHVAFAEASAAVWVTSPSQREPSPLGDLLGDGMDPRRASLWRRQLVLGPAPQYCLLSPEPTAGVAPTRLPAGWLAFLAQREVLFAS